MSNTLEHFFTGKFFRIPNYQRDYSWGIENIDDLIDDTTSSCYALALMSSHAHFLFRSAESAIAKVMRRLLTGYAI